jgi:uncharacterized protein YcbX
MSEVLAQVSKIFIYPIKSLPGIELEKAFLTKNGISCFDQPDIIDRKWMIVDEDGSFLSQRKDPKMALIKQTISDNRIVLTAPFMEHLPIPIKLEDAKKRQCRYEKKNIHLNFFFYVINYLLRLWTEFIDCLSYGKNSKISKWLSEFLGKENLDLVYFPDELLHLRSKAECSTFMLVSEASLADLNTKLTNQVTMRNFRPNIVVKGCEAFAEVKNFYKH